MANGEMLKLWQLFYSALLLPLFVRAFGKPENSRMPSHIYIDIVSADLGAICLEYGMANWLCANLMSADPTDLWPTGCVNSSWLIYGTPGKVASLWGKGNYENYCQAKVYWKSPHMDEVSQLQNVNVAHPQSSFRDDYSITALGESVRIEGEK